ncbi:MAG: S8 family serine peptidase, partial [Candidatus Cloacimonetes bacterium]|nr:S8 family serine peptidase [Candidatus Cloacimonadota bacterium]
MLKILIKITIFTLMIGLLSAEGLPFIEEYFYPRSIIVAFSRDAIGNRYGEIEFTRNDGIVVTHMQSFNRIAEEYRVVDLVQMHHSVTHLDWHDNGIHIQNIYRIVLESNDNIESAQIALVNEKDILFAEYETINRTRFIPNDPEYNLQWHHPRISMPQTWNYVQGSSEVIVAITDTGVKWNHPDLADNIWINEAELPGITIDWVNGMIYGGDGIDNDGNGFIDDVIGWDFVENNNNPYQNFPGNEHGTHVAGCAGAVGNNNIGVTGTAMNVSLMSCKGAPSNAPSGGVQYAYQQVQYAAQSGAHIINCSWGGPGSGTYANSVVNYATNLGSLVVAAAGNSNMEHNASYQDYPADAVNAFCVAATDPNDIKVNFSDYGVPIDISAPGVNIRSTWGNNTYYSTSGTSMSSPIVAGVAALVKSLHPEILPLDLRDRIMFTSDYIDDLNPDYAGLLGAGRVNAYRATMYDKIPHLSIYQHTLLEYSGDGDGVPNPGEEINLIFALYNDLYWLTATSVTATLSTEAPGVEILIDTVSFPNIDGGSVVLNTTNPFRFTTEATLSNLTIPFILTITANQSNPFPYEASFDYEVKLSLQQANWPFALSGTSNSSALLLDLDGDVRREIIFGDSQGDLWALKHNKTPLPGFPVNLGSNISAAVAAADLNNNGTTEIIANSQTGLINCVNPSGDILFQYNAGGQLRSNPMLVDVNNNGNLEIVALTFSNPRLIILNHDGTDFPGFPVTISAAVLSSPASADLNGDGHKEIIFNTSGGSLHAISTVTGTDIDGWPKSIGSAS